MPIRPLSRFAAAVLTCALIGSFASHAQAGDTVKAFILVGQSNMQGHGSMYTMNHQIKDDRTKAEFAELHEAGTYKTRDDVYINFLDRRGKLTVGYGKNKDWIGPELGFGWVVGDAIDEPVLIIKAAYGGRSLFRDFRSPSAGFPDDAELEKELAGRKKKDPNATLDDVKSVYGFAYRDMVGEIRNVRENYKTLFPELKDKKLEIAGLVWFQGWNDMISGRNSAAYTANLKHFINDVRKEVGDADLPFIIGQLGVGGEFTGADASKDKKEVFKANQAAAAEGLKNVAVVKTDQYWDKRADEQYKKWREDIDEWRKFGNDHGYHYLGSPLIVYRIGKGFGEQMLKMIDN